MGIVLFLIPVSIPVYTPLSRRLSDRGWHHCHCSNIWVDDCFQAFCGYKGVLVGCQRRHELKTRRESL
jgi:hypothetical protein